ncbi:MAG: hypothetical protein EBU00_04565, partial [Alphaproteobacteria bacterium]|nr:hypothetical protein [Alphaproteobacteria bacterium]
EKMVGVAGFEPKSSAITLWAKPNRMIHLSRGFDNALRKFIGKKWSEWRDSNPNLLRSRSGQSPTA